MLLFSVRIQNKFVSIYFKYILYNSFLIDQKKVMKKINKKKIII